MGIKNNRDENWKNANAREPQLLFACSKLIYLSVILYGRLIKEENVRHQLFLFLGESRAAIDRVQPTIGSVLLSHMTKVMLSHKSYRRQKQVMFKRLREKAPLVPLYSTILICCWVCHRFEPNIRAVIFFFTLSTGTEVVQLNFSHFVHSNIL